MERRREERNAKLSVLRTMLAYRGRMNHPECVAAINCIELVFNDNSGVTDKLKELLDYMDVQRNLPANEQPIGWQRRDDLTTELISVMSSSLGYKFGHTAIKRRAYLPQGYVDEVDYQVEIRKRLLNLAREDGLLVQLKEKEPQMALPHAMNPPRL
jgi:hypothetical protein